MSRTNRSVITLACTLTLALVAVGCGDQGPASPDIPVVPADQLTDLLNPNLASAAELTSAGATAEAVAAIESGRPFLDMLTLDTALTAHMDEPARQQLYLKVWVPIDLNAASDEELKLIPGVGRKMAHEFDEYRPYDGMERFRREIGKYVDDDEVARLARYVYLRAELNTASDGQLLAIPGVGERMLHEFKEYRPYDNLEQFRREIGKDVDDGEVARLERYVMLQDG